MADVMKVTVWNEFIHEIENEECKAVYPEGMHHVIAARLNEEGDMTARTATLREPEHGLTDDVLADTHVLIWWGHRAHGEVSDEIVEKVHERVMEGMGILVLHSGHYSKIFKKLVGTTASLKWREAGEKERLWVVNPGHAIARGIGQYIELPHTEMYGEFFDVPPPDELVFVSWFEGGEVFRSGLCYYRGNGKLFYFRPGHETFPIFKNPDVQKVLVNGVRWAAPSGGPERTFGNVKPLENLGD